MPICEIQDTEAFGNREAKCEAAWPKMAKQADWAPSITAPALKPSFALDPGEARFASGSCLARSVEHRFDRKGLSVPRHRKSILSDCLGMRPR